MAREVRGDGDEGGDGAAEEAGDDEGDRLREDDAGDRPTGVAECPEEGESAAACDEFDSMSGEGQDEWIKSVMESCPSMEGLPDLDSYIVIH